MSSDQSSRHPHSHNWTNRSQDSNDSRNPNASSSSMANGNRRNNRTNRRGSDRNGNGPSTSTTVHSVNSVMVAPLDDDGWGEPNPHYWVKKERQDERRRREKELRAQERAQDRALQLAQQERMAHVVGQAVAPLARHALIPPRGSILAQGAIAQGPASWYWNDIEPQADWGDSSNQLEAQSASETTQLHGFNSLSLLNSNDVPENGDCSKDSGVEVEKYDERTEDAILKVYHNDLLMETIISHITQLSERSRVEMTSSRMFTLSKAAPYLFSSGGDHLHIHFTTFDDFATIEYGSVVRTVPILTNDTKRFDKMESRMTIALHRILDNIKCRFAKKIRKITLGGTTEFYSARGVPDHHLILTYDFLKYLLTSFESVTSLHLINCGLDDGAIDICDSDLWKGAMARMEAIELRTVWAETASRLPEIMNSFTSNLQSFTLTRFTCKRMGAALMEQLRKGDCRLKDVQLMIDEDTAENDMEMLCLLKEVASRTESLRITMPEVGDGTKPSPRCFSILARLRDLPNLTELKVYVMPKTTGQFEAMISLFRDFEFLPSLRTLHIEGYVDQIWVKQEMVYNLADAFKTGMGYLAETLEDVSFANFPRPTRFNSTTYKGERKEGAYASLWNAMASSMGTRRTKRIALRNVFMDDGHLRRIYNSVNKVAEEIYLKNIRGATAKSVMPLVNGEFPMLRRMEAEIAVDPLVVSTNLAKVHRTPHLQYAKFALKHRISNRDHQMKTLKTIFSGVFVDQESPRGPLKQFLEMHHRIPGAKPPASEAEAQSVPTRTSTTTRAPRTTTYRSTAPDPKPIRRMPPKKLYGEWDDL